MNLKRSKWNERKICVFDRKDCKQAINVSRLDIGPGTIILLDDETLLQIQNDALSVRLDDDGTMDSLAGIFFRSCKRHASFTHGRRRSTKLSVG